MRDLNTPLAPSTFGPGGGKKKKMGGGKCHTKSNYYSICGGKKKQPTKKQKVVANIGGALPILGGIATAIAISKKNK